MYIPEEHLKHGSTMNPNVGIIDSEMENLALKKLNVNTF
jgi:hypothetical protein